MKELSALTVKKIRTVCSFSMQEGEFHRYNADMDHSELIIMLKGENRTVFRNKTMQIAPGCVYLLPEGHGNDMYEVTRLSDGLCIDVFFETEGPLPTEAVIESVDSPTITALFCKLERVWMARERGWYHRSLSLLYQIFSILEDSREEYLPSDLSDRLKPGVDYIEEYCFSPLLDLEKPHTLCGMSRTYFSRLYKQRYGESAMQRVTRLRLERAGELIESGMFSVTEAATAVGYRDVYHFSHLFREKMGCPPSAYPKMRNRQKTGSADKTDPVIDE